MNIRRLIFWIAAAAIITSPAILLLIVPPPAKADRPQNVFHSERARSKVGDAGDETAEALAAAEQYAQARTAPGVVLPGAYGAAFTALSTLPVAGGTWAEVTNRPYDSDDARYRDPFYSNSSGGSGLVAGRITGLAVGNGAIYAGGADGGVFRSRDGGSTWTPLTDKLPTLSVGDVKLGADGALWLATGEGNTGSTAYVGSGVYRLTRPLTDVFTTATRVGGTELESTFVHRLQFDDAGSVYAATSRGLWKHAATTNTGGWRRVLYPVSDPVVGGVARPDLQSPYNNICNDVAIQPGTGGRVVIANCAWRGGAAYNGFYLSTDGGTTFAKTNPLGALNPKDVGRSQFAYSADGSQLYATVESMTHYNNSLQTALSGVYNSPSGEVTGPWNKIGDSGKLGASNSALQNSVGYHPGIQAWYNQFVAVEPGDPNHVYVGLEEVYESRNGGGSWATIGPYWNFDFKCWSILDAANTCPPTTHSDQHSIAFGNGRVYVGNDGGLYSRPIDGTANADGHATDWVSHNANLRTLQYYSVGVGRVPGGVAVAGGLQDNGGSLLLPEDRTGSGKMGSPFGGDGGDIIVDPDDGCKILDEYVYLTLWLTENCGRTNGLTHAIRDVSISDPSPRFTAPFRADAMNKNFWIAGGRYLWKNDKGFAIQRGSEWIAIFDNGAGRSTTAIGVQNGVIYSAWCGPCNDAGFARGISTNAGGNFRQLNLPAQLPNRYVSAVAIDPADASGMTMFVGFNGFSRRFTEGPGAGLGHLWKTVNAGASWTDVSGNLPDVPINDVVITAGKLVVGTDLGTVVSLDGGAHWSRLGSNLPYTTVMDLHLGVDGLVYAATHGRGIWSIAKP
jgi:signal peptidase I